MISTALYQPDIAQNTAAIIRICACFEVNLEIIRPCGYFFDKKKLDRIYLDYLENCSLKFYESYDEFIHSKKNARIILATTKTNNEYTNFIFKKNDTILFGRESAGVPESVHSSISNKITIPMNKNVRSFNIASSVAIICSEVVRQLKLTV